MGGERAVRVRGDDSILLRNFNDVLAAELELTARDWAVFGRVTVFNDDGDPQHSSAQILADDGTIIDTVRLYLQSETEACFSLHGLARLGFQLSHEGPRAIKLVCSTYKGFASKGSLLAIAVDQAIDQ